MNGFTPLDGETPSKKLENYAAGGSTIAQDAVVATDLQSMSAFTPRNTGAGSDEQFILYSYANDWTNDVSRETYVLVNVPVKDAGNTAIAQIITAYRSIIVCRTERWGRRRVFINWNATIFMISG